MPYEPKILPFEKNSLEGISEKTIDFHYEKLYKGYVKKYNEIQERLPEADTESANANYSEWRGLKIEETYNLDAIILHELYFSNLGGDGQIGGREVKNVLENQFGSLVKFIEQMSATGMASRGWTVAAINSLTNEIQIYAQDLHNSGVVWQATPLLILDMYEHAFVADYGSDRGSYIKSFWKNIDWEVVNMRFQAVQ
jgi:Fe-Mn family superoxide dismutase